MVENSIRWKPCCASICCRVGSPLATRPCKLKKRGLIYKAERQIENLKAQARAKVEHPFRVIKR
jgi:hypothetical protein